MNQFARSFFCLAAILGVFAGSAHGQDTARGNVFTVAKYPVDASATNAVAAKREATERGRRSAYRSLLKRIVPAASYPLIEQLAKIDPAAMIASVQVRSEVNSATQYIATLDFSFDPDAVRALLAQHAVPYLDQPAPETSVMVFYGPPSGAAPKAMAAAAGAASWRSVWNDLDLGNSITPIKLIEAPGDLTAETRQALISGNAQTLADLGARFSTSQLVVAYAEPVLNTKDLAVTLAGQDAVGRFSVTTRYRLDDEDFAYSLELAAVIAQAVVEARWKQDQTGGGPGRNGGAGGGGALLTVLAEFDSLGHWQRQQQALSSIPGVRDVQIGSLSARSASVSLVYPGGGSALQTALGQQGLALENINGFWVLR